ncbi:MAG: transcription termination factor Rho [Cytophagales bacterium]|nr:transcription termination factor Rho [Cytophagales bacterium]
MPIQENDAARPRRFESVSTSRRYNKDNISIHESQNVEACSGVLEVLPDNNYGFLRGINSNFSATPNDVYVSPNIIRTYHLRSGDIITGQMRLLAGTEKYNSLMLVNTINGERFEDIKDRKAFESLTPIFPDKQIKLETEATIIATRVIDLFAPIGFGQRGMIVAQPKSGKTELLKQIAGGISKNSPEAVLMVLLVGERPEEVTDMRRNISGEVIASTFDESAERQVKISMYALEKAKREVERGKDVIILMDSITRFARACNIITPSSGRVLSGGMEINALYLPKKFFGAARNIEDGGSLTIIATALVDTGSKMDDLIFEEFKGTGNMELKLNRDLADKRVFPAIDVVASGTRRDDLLLDEKVINKSRVLRRFLIEDKSQEPIDFLIAKMRRTQSNAEFLDVMSR